MGDQPQANDKESKAYIQLETHVTWANNAIWRAHDRALERGALAFAIARADLSPLKDRAFFKHRLRVVLEELLHDFAFNARRAIECADAEANGLIRRANDFRFTRGHVSFRASEAGDDTDLCQESYWWVLNRVVHSRATVVLPRPTQVRFERDTPSVKVSGTDLDVGELGIFAVRSDRDPADQFHFVRVDDFVAGYLDELQRDVGKVVEDLTLHELGVTGSGTKT